MKHKSRTSPSSSGEMPQDDPIVMYIFVNKSLNMGTGKIAAQVGHGVHAVVESASLLRSPHRQWYNAWNDSAQPIVVLKATEEQMNTLSMQCECKEVYDAGRTEVCACAFTVLALYPMPKSRTSFGSFQLL